MGKRILLYLLIALTPFALYRGVWGRLPLDEILFNYDEGVYYLQAQRIERGEKPFRDFLTHQPPLYPYLLAYLLPQGFTLLDQRILSLLFWILTTTAVGLWTASHYGIFSALLAETILLSTPLTLYALQGTPHAPSLGFLTLGILFFFSRKRWGVVLCGLFFSLSFLLKPLVLSALLAGAFYLLLRRDFERFFWYSLSLILSGVFLLALLHLLEEPLFFEIIRAQVVRYGEHTGFETFSYCPIFSHELAQRGLRTPFSWNLSELQLTLLGKKARLATLPLSFILFLSLLNGLGRKPKESLFFLLYLGLTLIFFLFFFEPIWDHYTVHLILPLAFLAPMALSSILKTFLSQKGWRETLSALFCLYLVVFALRMNLPFFRYHKGNPLKLPERVLTFNPTLALLLQSQPACGLEDPFNTFSQRASFARFLKEKLPPRLVITPERLESCLAKNPEIPILFDPWTECFLSRDQVREWERKFSGRILYTFMGSRIPFYPGK